MTSDIDATLNTPSIHAASAHGHTKSGKLEPVLSRVNLPPAITVDGRTQRAFLTDTDGGSNAIVDMVSRGASMMSTIILYEEHRYPSTPSRVIQVEVALR
jgi:hypothetical protein